MRVCRCAGREDREKNWIVVDRECHYEDVDAQTVSEDETGQLIESAFSGSHYTPSDYSRIRCLKCGRYWRSKGKYVRLLRDATREEATRAI